MLEELNKIDALRREELSQAECDQRVAAICREMVNYSHPEANHSPLIVLNDSGIIPYGLRGNRAIIKAFHEVVDAMAPEIFRALEHEFKHRAQRHLVNAAVKAAMLDACILSAATDPSQ